MVPIYGFYFAAVNRLFGNVAVNAMTADITNRECCRLPVNPQYGNPCKALYGAP